MQVVGVVHHGEVAKEPAWPERDNQSLDQRQSPVVEDALRTEAMERQEQVGATGYSSLLSNVRGFIDFAHARGSSLQLPVVWLGSM